MDTEGVSRLLGESEPWGEWLVKPEWRDEIARSVSGAVDHFLGCARISGEPKKIEVDDRRYGFYAHRGRAGFTQASFPHTRACEMFALGSMPAFRLIVMTRRETL